MVLKVRNQNVCFCVSQAIKLLDMLNCPWSNFDGYAWTRTCALRKRWTAPGAWTDVSDALFWSEIAEQASHRFPNNYVFVFFFPRDLQHNFFSLSVFSGWSFWSPRIVFWVFFICLGFVFFCSELSRCFFRSSLDWRQTFWCLVHVDPALFFSSCCS